MMQANSHSSTLHRKLVGLFYDATHGNLHKEEFGSAEYYANFPPAPSAHDSPWSYFQFPPTQAFFARQLNIATQQKKMGEEVEDRKG
jgi:hypothetical protein